MTTPGEVRNLRNVAVLGHKGSGKTSLVEALLYVARATPKLGRAGERASGLDDSSEERAHLTTLEARPVSFRWNGAKLNVIDTPGEASFMADARLALVGVRRGGGLRQRARRRADRDRARARLGARAPRAVRGRAHEDG